MFRVCLKFSVIVVFCLLCRQAGAETGLSEEFRSEVRHAQDTPTSTSASGQFIIHGVPKDTWQMISLSPSLAPKFVRLNVPLLTVTCERVKSALLSNLGAQDQWHDTIAIFLHQTRRLDETIVIGSSINGRDWTYYLNLPDTVERGRLISALVNVMLLEMANRGARRSAEIPPWLAQGLTQQLIHESMTGLVMDAPKDGNKDIQTSSELIEGTSKPPLEQAHEVLQANPPLSIAELSWPRERQDEDEAYRCSAQLLVCRLLQMDDGRQSMRRTIGGLSQHLNWQIAFLDAFHRHFDNELEFEKWWALCVVDFAGRDLAENWSHAESWQKLEEVVHMGAQVRTAADDLPLHTQVTLQSIISDWGFLTQDGVLRGKMQQLAMVRASASQDIAQIANDYWRVLDNYLKTREKSGALRNTKNARVGVLDHTALEAIRQLNALDAEREAMKNGPVSNGETVATAPVIH